MTSRTIMKTNKTLRSAAFVWFALAHMPQAGAQGVFAPVEQAARERSRSIVTWEREQKAREQALAEVRRLLRAPR